LKLHLGFKFDLQWAWFCDTFALWLRLVGFNVNFVDSSAAWFAFAFDEVATSKSAHFRKNNLEQVEWAEASPTANQESKKTCVTRARPQSLQTFCSVLEGAVCSWEAGKQSRAPG